MVDGCEGDHVENHGQRAHEVARCNRIHCFAWWCNTRPMRLHASSTQVLSSGMVLRPVPCLKGAHDWHRVANKREPFS
eukprot:2367729-Amphidinium_carterae.1